MRWDVFISHAREDRATVARPLADALRRRGLRVWLDEQELVLGDSVRRKVNQGLARSRWGVLVLSRAFLDKEWPRAELDGLLPRELSGERVILPVWHGVTGAEVARRSPILAARMAVDTAQGLDAVCAAILAAIARDVSVPTAEPPRPALLALWRALLENPGYSRWEVSRQLEQREAYAGYDVGGYTLRELVGIGATGAVFRAVHTAFGRTVALKLLFPFGDDLRVVTQATERAVRGLSSLRDPGIAPLLDYGYLRIGAGAAPYLASEFIDGATLLEWSRALQAEAATDPRAVLSRRLNVAIAATEALGKAHGASFVDPLGIGTTGIMHGDLKPGNILVRRKDDRPVLLDFMMPDIQRMASERLDSWNRWEKDTEGMYQVRVPVSRESGTPGYVPPEQEKDGIVTPRSDVYSLGRTFEDLFLPDTPGWRWPHSASGPCAAAEAEMGRLIGAMKARQPEARPASAAEVLARLREIRAMHEAGAPAGAPG